MKQPILISGRPIAEVIKQRRAQMLVHSCIYYELDDNIVSDHQWQAWADELEKIQNEYPDEINIGFFDWEFRDWDNSTGAHLPHREPWVFAKANQLLYNRDHGLHLLYKPNGKQEEQAKQGLESFFG